MREYTELCESLTMKKTVVTRYPRQINLSEEFREALKNEVSRLTTVTEDTSPIKNFDEKFLKAIRFEINEQ